MQTLSEIQAKNAALLEAAPSNDNDPWGRLNQLQDECIRITGEMVETQRAMNTDMARSISC